MMFKALYSAAFRKYKRMLISLAAGMFAFQLLMGAMFDPFAPYFSESGFTADGAMPDALGVFTGGANMFDPAGWLGVGFAHPIPIVLIVAWALVTSASAVAKEIEDGTAELLFTRPVARAKVLTARVVHFLAGLATLLAASFIGAVVGMQFSETLSAHVGYGDVLLMVASYIPLALLVAGLGFAVSAAVSQRSIATSTVTVFVVASYFLNFAGQLWEPLKDVVGLSVFYQTVPAVWAMDGPRLGPVVAIIVISGALTAAAYWILNRRNILA